MSGLPSLAFHQRAGADDQKTEESRISQMIIGFTGSRKGMSENQKAAFQQLIQNLHIIPGLHRGHVITELHHGMCVGADHQAHKITRNLYYDVTIIGHPSSEHNCVDVYCDATLPARPALKRNLDIVDYCDILIATPGTKQEVLRSGTWATIRYARKLARKVMILDPYIESIKWKY